MKKLQQQKGFTLVELAIVLTIIGLLIGGLLKGQQLIENARVSSTVSQVHAIEAAVNTFRETYGMYPGDLLNAQTRVPNCGTCGLAAAATAGDGIIGSTTWDMLAFQSTSFTAANTGTAAQETVLFWVEMAKAGLISGVNDDGISNVAAQFGQSLPAAKIGGGFTVGYANVTATQAPPGRPAGATKNMIGTVLALAPVPPAALSATAAIQAVTPSVARQLDEKMDDGVPNTGTVQAYGVGASCYGAAAPFIYDGSIQSKDCGLYVKINN